MPKFLLIGQNGTLGTAFKQLLPSEDTAAPERDRLDITNQEQVQNFFTEHQPEVVINCSAYTNVDGAESDFSTAYQINAEAVGYLSAACNQIKARLIHFSTGMVFGGTNPTGYNESDTPNPINKYGESKLAGEKIIQNTAQKYYIVRTEWLYGKPVSETAKKSFVEIMLDLGQTGKVKAVNDETGKPTWAKDLAQAVIDLIDSKRENGLYHLTNEGVASREDWTKEIYVQKGMSVEIESVPGSTFPRPAKRPEFELLNNTKLPKLRSWQEALAEYLKQ